MKRLIIFAFSIQLLLLAPLSTAASQSMGSSGGHDLDALFKKASSTYDLSHSDAVFLLDSKKVELTADGRRRTTVHTVVWIGTEVGVNTYADLRIPWNSAVSTFSADILRTWRDGRWWPDEKKVSPTAVVETLPFAVARADDYSPMRETMLLHDGVGIPCIMETEYVVEEKPGDAGGWDGSFVMARQDPSVLCEYIIEAPSGIDIHTGSLSGAGDPKVSEAEGGNTRRYYWKVEDSAGLGLPAPGHPELYAPAVIWSTWKSWKDLGGAFTSVFDAAAVLDGALKDSVATRLEGVSGDACRAAAISDLAGELVRDVQYDPGFWEFTPRPAARVFATAYGHPLDRAVLAAAMFRDAGYQASPVFYSMLKADRITVPGISMFGGMALCVRKDRFHALYDPSSGSLRDAPGVLFGCSVFKPSDLKAPAMKPDGDNSGMENLYAIDLTMEPKDEGGAWNGSGYMRCEGLFSPKMAMTGSSGSGASFLGGELGAVISGAGAGQCEAEVLETARVEAAFDFTSQMGDRDKAGRIRLDIGEPGAGLMSRLPGDVHLFQEARTSPVFIRCPMTQRVSVRIRMKDLAQVYIPGPVSIENEAGSFVLKAAAKDGWLTVTRTLSLKGGMVGPDAWPALRALLLEEKDGANRMVMFR